MLRVLAAGCSQHSWRLQRGSLAALSTSPVHGKCCQCSLAYCCHPQRCHSAFVGYATDQQKARLCAKSSLAWPYCSTLSVLCTSVTRIFFPLNLLSSVQSTDKPFICHTIAYTAVQLFQGWHCRARKDCKMLLIRSQFLL